MQREISISSSQYYSQRSRVEKKRKRVKRDARSVGFVEEMNAPLDDKYLKMNAQEEEGPL
jgi:hypothetical protein